LFRVGIDDFYNSFAICWILELNLDRSGNSQRRFDVVHDDWRFRMASQVKLIQNFTYLRIDEAQATLLLTHLQRKVLQLIVIFAVGFQLKCRISIESNSIDYNLIAIFSATTVRYFNLLNMSFSYFTFHVQCLESYWIVGDN